MSNSKNPLSVLIDQLVGPKSSALAFSRFVQPLIAANSSTSKSTSASEPLGSLGLKASSALFAPAVKSIGFGKPSSNTTPASSSTGSTWQGLLSQTASGGLASALTGGLSSIAGLGGLISDIGKLFGGGSSKPAPPPLTLFSLPTSIQQTAYLASNGAHVYAGDSADQPPKAGPTLPIYTTTGMANTAGHNPVSAATDSAAIAQAVKNALLTSNTLGDVIAEL